MEDRGTIKSAVLHCHTYYSTKDSAMSPEDLVKACAELGAKAVAKTDHRTLAGEAEFIDACKKYGVKPILGVEADKEDGSEGRKHMILLEKDYIGHVAVNKAVTESNKRVEYVGKLAFPRMDSKILMKYFGPGSEGHGHVIATSACVVGVLAGYYSSNDKSDKSISKLKKKLSQFDEPDEETMKANERSLEEKKARVKELRDQISAAKKTAGKSTAALENRLAKANDEDKKEAISTQIAEIKKQAAEAAENAMKLKAELDELLVGIKTISDYVKKAQAEANKYYSIKKQVDEAEAGKLSMEETERLVERDAKIYEKIFGKGNFYIELQYHGLPKEKEVMPKLAMLAKKLGIPTVLANDAHMPTNSTEDVMARAIMRTTMFDSWSDPTASDKELYVRTDEELIKAVSQIIPEEDVMEAYRNIQKISDECNVELPNGSHYPEFEAPDGSTPGEYLRKMAYAGVKTHYPDNFDQEKKDRLEYELSTIHEMGFDSYFCIVEDFLSYAREAGKLNLNDPEEQKIALTFDTAKIREYVKDRAGECVGPGRGSAAGSIVCYLTGITNIDPIEFGLLFERFLNPERVSMPDIDCDIETNVRAYVIEYVKNKYGADSVSGIMTATFLTGKAALRTARSVYSIRTHGDSMYYASLGDALSKKAEEINGGALGISLKAIEEELRQAFTGNKAAGDIITYALLIENVCDHFGQHAAGIIIADGHPVDDYVPLMQNKLTDMMVTQCDKNQAEKDGLLKMDFLGLMNLTVITRTLQLIQETEGRLIDMDRIPYEPEVFSEIFAEGMTDCVFQFESAGMKKMLKEFKPETIFDLTLLVAMYRPGPIQFLKDVISVKTGKKPPEFLTKELKPILGNTYGAITYQEQVQQIFRSLAGYSYGQADLVRRAMSKKKEDVLMAERNSFINGDAERDIKGCVANGISETAASMLFEQMTEFAKYAFNKSHAACYAVVAYQTAWLKHHYPVQYMSSVMNQAEFKKYPDLISDVRRMGIKLLPPDVNASGIYFEPEDLMKGGKGIRFGLSQIKGIGEVPAGAITRERSKNGPYKGLGDFVCRAGADKKVYDALSDAGAFDCFTESRSATKDMLPTLKKQAKALSDLYKKYDIESDEKKGLALLEKINKAKEEIYAAKPGAEVCENQVAKLDAEKEVLGGYVSSHPLDLYPDPKSAGASEIADVIATGPQKNVTVAGIVSNYKEKARRKDGAKLAFFTLTDRTGSIEVCVFSRAFETMDDMVIKDGSVVKITGKTIEGQEDTQEIKLSLDKVTALRPFRDAIILAVSVIVRWETELREKVLPYKSVNGNELYIYDEHKNRIRKTGVRVSPDVLAIPGIRGVKRRLRAS